MYTTISDKAVAAVMSSTATKRQVFERLMIRFGMITRDTPRTWFRKKHYGLSHPDAVSIIAEITGLAYDEIVTSEVGDCPLVAES